MVTITLNYPVFIQSFGLGPRPFGDLSSHRTSPQADLHPVIACATCDCYWRSVPHDHGHGLAEFRVLDIHGLGLNTDTDMIRVAQELLIEFAEIIDRPDADALAISCGALRAIELVDETESRIGKPVICRNQAMLWDRLELAGVCDRRPGLGRHLGAR
ncbi:MAG TPA: hypothetical protein VIS76_11385 [Pseudomonadales bacterium]|jgi:hypothetical protein